MANLIIPPDFQAGPAAIFGGVGFDDDLGAAITGGFGLIGFRGKTWSIKHKGNELPLMRPDGDGPLNSIEVVILKAPNHLSKTWYKDQFSEGSTAAPDCASSNGETPDAGVPHKQADACLTCKWNAFGSRPAQPGQTQVYKGKACSDTKRLAVVPLGDIMNEQFGGPLLLRCPPASLSDLVNFSNLLKQIGYPYYAIGVKIGFDTTVAYPKFIFKPIRPLTDAEGKMVLEMRDMPLVDTIIHGDAPSRPANPVPPQAEAPPTAATVAPVAPTPEAKPDNVVPMQQPQQQPPTQAAGAKQATGFGGVTEAPASTAAPALKTASGGGFGGAAQAASPAAAEPTGVAEFDAMLDKKLEGLL